VEDFGGVHNWNEMSVDETRGIVFIPFGTARYDFYGADRHGQDLYGNSIVALDARTESVCGISRRFTMTCGITICPQLRSCSP
jgi:glucose dehydrogenase